MLSDSRRMFLLSLGCLGALGAAPIKNLAQAADVRRPKANDRRIITIYFSWAGSCRDVAREVQRLIGGDLVRLETVEPYPAKYEDTVSRSKAESKANLRPALKPIPDLSGYDIVCIGHPIWSGSMPMALYSFFDSHDLSGKTLVHFNTHGGSGQGDSHREIARLEPKAKLLEGLAVYGWGGVRDMPSVEKWLKRIGLIKAK